MTGFRFRRSIRLGKGLRINLSKSGASLSVGRRGATMNFGPKGKKLTVGLPGTGISYSTMLNRTSNDNTPAAGADPLKDKSSGFLSPLAWLAAIAIAVAMIGAIASGYGH